MAELRGSHAGNLVGCLAMVAVVQAAGIYATAGGNAAVNIAVAKTSLSFGQVRSWPSRMMTLRLATVQAVLGRQWCGSAVSVLGALIQKERVMSVYLDVHGCGHSAAP